VSDLGLSFFFPSGNFERFFGNFFRKKNKKAKRHPREEEEEEEEEKVGISTINALLRKRVFSFN